MENVSKLFQSFNNQDGKIFLNNFMEICFAIKYKVRVWDFSKIRYDDTLDYDFPEQAPKKYTKLIVREHTTWFRYTDDELELKCKVLEWLSRPASKEGDSTTQNWYRCGINKFLGTNFSTDDMHDIYCKLGNKVNRGLCLYFITNNYDVSVLEVEK